MSDSVVEVAYAVRTPNVVIIRIIKPPEKKIVKLKNGMAVAPDTHQDLIFCFQTASPSRPDAARFFVTLPPVFPTRSRHADLHPTRKPRRAADA